MNDFFNLFVGITTPGQRVALDSVDGDRIEVSTVYAHDINMYETALIDSDGAHPVERYDSEEEALEGHKKWMNSKVGDTVTKLGYGHLVDSKTIVLS
jgi:hypothetical protein